MIPLILGGACQFGSIWGILSSVRYIPAPITIIIMFLHTIMLLGYTAYKKEISWEKSLIVVTLVALLGVSFVVDVWAHSSRINWIGVGFAFFAALMTAVRLYVFGKEVKLESPTVVGAQVFSVSTACVLLYAFFNLPIQHPDTLEGLLWAVMCAGALSLGTYGMFLGIAELGAFQWSLMAKLEPMCTVGFAFLILGEALHGIQYLGMLLILGALISYQLLQHNRKSC